MKDVKLCLKSTLTTMMQCPSISDIQAIRKEVVACHFGCEDFLYLPCYHKLVILRELNSFCMQTLIFEKLLKIYKSR